MATQAQINALNAAREKAVASGQSAYSGNLASISSFTGSQPSSTTSSVLKPGGLDTLNNYTPPNLGKPAAGIVPQVFAGSTTTSSGGAKDYTTPSSSFTPSQSVAQSTPAFVPEPPKPAQVYAPSTNPISGAFNALKNLLTGGGSYTNSQSAAVAQSLQPKQPNQSVLPTPNATASFSEPNDSTFTSTVSPTSQVGGRISDQYSVVTQDKNSSSEDQKKKIDAIKQQEDVQNQAQIQNIQAQLAQKKAELAALQSQQPPELPGQQFPTYNPEGQGNISNLTAQIQAMEAEINKALEGSPEYQAANQALNQKIAEEAAINARLTQGKANVAEQPIAYNFISGQQSALQNRANADLQTNAAQRIPLQQQLATEQAKKAAASDVAKTKYGFLNDERDRATSAYTTNYNRANTVADRATEQANNLALKKAETKTTSTSSNGASSKNISDLKNALNASKFQGAEADGKYADPNLYLQNYQNWLASGGTADDFFRNFPPKTYINPDNTWLPQEIMQFVKERSL